MKSEGNNLLKGTFNVGDKRSSLPPNIAFARATQAANKYLHALRLTTIGSKQKAQLYKNLSKASEV